MIFNFFLANQPAERLKKLYDVLRPIEHGLTECGHHVIGYGLGLCPAPAVNVMVEFFPDDEFVGDFLKLKSEAGDRLILGVLSPNDVEDDAALETARYPRRRANLDRVLAVADFAWTLLPQLPRYEAVCGPGNAATIEFGFTPRLLNPQVISRAELRDLDVVIDGEATPRRRDIVEALKQRGLRCHVTGTVPLPSFATADLARRAKIFLDARRSATARFSSMPRICKGLHSGTMVLAEHPAASLPLDRFTVTCDPEKVVDHCVASIHSGMTISLGRAALDRFRAETSMRDGLAAALRLPIFQRLAG